VTKLATQREVRTLGGCKYVTVYYNNQVVLQWAPKTGEPSPTGVKNDSRRP